MEDFFLGMSNDDLFEKYPGKIVNHIDILEYLRNNKSVTPESSVVENKEYSHQENFFLPRKQEFYNRDNLLTIGHQTKKVKRWLIEDPVALHRTIVENEIVIEADDFNVLFNKLRLEHFTYYRDFLRLNILIEFPGYENLVKASVPYKDQPVKFYKWWRRHKDSVTLNLKEKVELYLAVDKQSPMALVKADKELIKK